MTIPLHFAEHVASNVEYRAGVQAQTIPASILFLVQPRIPSSEAALADAVSDAALADAVSDAA